MTERATNDRTPSALLLTALTVASAALIANLYYAQPIVASIAPGLGIAPDLAGSVVSVTQVGYGIGLLLVVPLADLVDNRKLVLLSLAATTVGLVGTALSTAAAPFFAAAFLVGFCATGAQVLQPFVARLVPEEQRGRAIGNMMAGVLTGIMLARPVSLFVAASFGWRTVFWGSAVLLIGVGAVLARTMPRHRPASRMGYGQILGSMAGLLRDRPTLRWRSASQALMFGAFNTFWTAAPLMLADRFNMGGHGIGLFALVGAGGALAAPLAGRLADRGFGPMASAGAMIVLCLAFFATGWAAAATALVVLAVLAVVMDAAVQTNLVISQRVVFAVPDEIRGRANAVFVTTLFAGGAIGSMLGTLTYHYGGWTGTAITGGTMGAAALLLLAIERHRNGKSETVVRPTADSN